MLKCSQFSGWNSQSPFFFNEEIKCGSTFHKYKFNSMARGHRRFLFCRNKCTHSNVMYFVAVSTSTYHMEDKIS